MFTTFELVSRGLHTNNTVRVPTIQPVYADPTHAHYAKYCYSNVTKTSSIQTV